MKTFNDYLENTNQMSYTENSETWEGRLDDHVAGMRNEGGRLIVIPVEGYAEDPGDWVQDQLKKYKGKDVKVEVSINVTTVKK